MGIISCLPWSGWGSYSLCYITHAYFGSPHQTMRWPEPSLVQTARDTLYSVSHSPSGQFLQERYSHQARAMDCSDGGSSALLFPCAAPSLSTVVCFSTVSHNNHPDVLDLIRPCSFMTLQCCTSAYPKFSFLLFISELTTVCTESSFKSLPIAIAPCSPSQQSQPTQSRRASSLPEASSTATASSFFPL